MKSCGLLFAFSLLCMTSCHERMEPSFACSVSDPIENIGWLSERVQELEANLFPSYFYIIKASYLSKTVFVILSCCPSCSSPKPSVINCEGETIGHLGIDEGGIDYSRFKDVEVIWKGKKFACII